jgi:hypothetical protein
MSNLYVIQCFLSSPTKHIHRSIHILHLSPLRQSISPATISLPVTHGGHLSLSLRVALILPFFLFQFLSQRSLGNGRKMNKIFLSSPCVLILLIFQLISLIDLYIQKVIMQFTITSPQYRSFTVEVAAESPPSIVLYFPLFARPMPNRVCISICLCCMFFLHFRLVWF